MNVSGCLRRHKVIVSRFLDSTNLTDTRLNRRTAAYFQRQAYASKICRSPRVPMFHREHRQMGGNTHESPCQNLVIALSLAMVALHTVVRPRSVRAANHYKYLVVESNWQPEAIQDELNKRAAEGWELATPVYLDGNLRLT